MNNSMVIDYSALGDAIFKALVEAGSYDAVNDWLVRNKNFPIIPEPCDSFGWEYKLIPAYDSMWAVSKGNPWVSIANLKEEIARANKDEASPWIPGGSKHLLSLGTQITNDALSKGGPIIAIGQHREDNWQEVLEISYRRNSPIKTDPLRRSLDVYQMSATSWPNSNLGSLSQRRLLLVRCLTAKKGS